MKSNMPIQSDFRSLLFVAMLATSVLVVSGCRLGLSAEDVHDDAAAASPLTDTRLVDQNGKTMSLAALKGKPLVVDFIYTSCPGPCLMETAKLTNVAVGLGADLGWKVAIVSIMTVPPSCTNTRSSRERTKRAGTS
jgi:protein SCO1